MIAMLAVGISACSSRPDIQDFPKSANAKQEMTKLEIAIDDSKFEDSDLLAPVSFKKAQEYLVEAREMEKENVNKDKVLKEVAYGKAYLDQAKQRSQNNRAKILDIIVARQAAMSANANSLVAQDFSRLDNGLKKEMAKIENKERDQLKDKRSDFIAGYLDLELRAIKKTHLGESKFLIDESIKNGARDLAPKTLATTEKKYQEADLYITENRYNTAEMTIQSADVLKEAKNLESTTATARGLTAMSTEETALRMQAEEARLNDELGTSKALAASNAEMSKNEKLNAIYEEARQKFSPDEAEVYKQGSNLVIRLRALEFSPATAIIKGEKFALLKKVEDVIQSIDKSSVIVEGHTDSTGGKNQNQKLSAKRAEAVKQYLEVNSSDKVVEFESKGFGYEKPLATNKTAEGRAQNRRVDVIIEPVNL
jgi:outer membrane protein OmpA-like peptidoglycan-associated protein